jgi:hypothetical protein
LAVKDKNTGGNKFESNNWSLSQLKVEYLSYSPKDFEGIPSNSLGTINEPFYTKLGEHGIVLGVFPVNALVDIKEQSVVKITWPDGSADLQKKINFKVTNCSVFITDVYLNGKLAWNYIK